MKYLLDIIYIVGLLVTSLFWISRMLFQGRYRACIKHRFGYTPKSYGLQPVIWIHGVSVGEINAAKPLVDEIARTLPEYRVVISSTTDTGYDAANRAFSPKYTTLHWPLDFSWAVSKAIIRINPAIVVLMEGEAWPNFLAECNRRNIPTMIANGRMSPNKGFPRYKKLGKFSKRLFSRLSAISVQDEIYGENFRALGVPPEKVHLTGMLKFESINISKSVDGQEDLASDMGISSDSPLLVAGGTGNDEEIIILDVWKRLKNNHPALQLAIVPRKPERFDEVARMIRSNGLDVLRRSESTAPPTTSTDYIILGDTMGELRKFYALSTISFIGRSLVPMGGSDMIEAAAMGKPTCFGTHTYNFPQTKGLLKHGCQEVADADALFQLVDHWLTNPQEASSSGQTAQQYIVRQQGAAKRNVTLMCHLLGLQAPLGDHAIATEPA